MKKLKSQNILLIGAVAVVVLAMFVVVFQGGSFVGQAISQEAVAHHWTFDAVDDFKVAEGMSKVFADKQGATPLLPKTTLSLNNNCVSSKCLRGSVVEGNLDNSFDSDFTISAWVKPGNEGVIMSAYKYVKSGEAYGWYLGKTNPTSNKLAFVAYGGDVDNNYVAMALPIENFYVDSDGWRHVLVSFGAFNKLTGLSTARIYIDGVLRATSQTRLKEIWYGPLDGDTEVPEVQFDGTITTSRDPRITATSPEEPDTEAQTEISPGQVTYTTPDGGQLTVVGSLVLREWEATTAIYVPLASLSIQQQAAVELASTYIDPVTEVTMIRVATKLEDNTVTVDRGLIAAEALPGTIAVTYTPAAALFSEYLVAPVEKGAEGLTLIEPEEVTLPAGGLDTTNPPKTDDTTTDSKTPTESTATEVPPVEATTTTTTTTTGGIIPDDETTPTKDSGTLTIIESNPLDTQVGFVGKASVPTVDLVTTFQVGGIGDGYIWDGSIDELKVLNHVATPEEVAELALLHYWSFDQATDLPGYDDLGAAGSAIQGGSVIINQPCVSGLCVGGAAFKTTVSQAMTKDFTISAWVKPGTKGVIMSSYKFVQSGVAYGWYLGNLGTSNRLGFVGYGGDSNNAFAAGALHVDDFFDNNKWNHVALTFGEHDANAGLSEANIYVNGVVKATVNVPLKEIWYAAPDGTNAVENLQIGGMGAGHIWDGDLDELQVYNRVLSGSEIQSKYEKELTVGVDSSGGFTWDADRYLGNDEAILSFSSGDVNPGTVDTLKVIVTSTTDVRGKLVNLIETSANSGVFQTKMIFSTIEDINSGDLMVAPGDVVRAEVVPITVEATPTQGITKKTWSFDADNIGQGLEGALVLVPGVSGEALSLDGSSYIGIPDVSKPEDTSLDLMGDFTIGFWLRLDNVEAQVAQVILTKRPDNDNYVPYAFSYDNRGGEKNLNFLVGGGAGEINLLSLSNVLRSGEWAYVTAGMEGNTIKLSVNGGELVTSIFNGVRQSNEGGITIGKYGGVDDYYFSGAIDELELHAGVVGIFTDNLVFNSPIAKWDFETEPTGATHQTADCISGNCVSFSGGEEVAVDLPNLPTGDMSISVWVKPTVPSVGGYLASAWAGNRGWLLGASTGDSNKLVFSVFDATGGNSKIRVDNFFNTYRDQWTHVGVTFAPNEFPKMYINGVEQSGTNTANGAGGIDYTGVTTMNIGSLGGQHYLTGAMDELEIYNRVLSAEEIGKKFLAVPRDSPIAKWDFETEPTGATHQTTDCISGNCVSFSGAEEVAVDLPNLPTGDMSISVWVKPGANVDGDYLASAWVGNRGWLLGASSVDSHKLVFSVFDAIGGNSKIRVDNFFNTYRDQWTHVGVTFAPNEVPKMYINGVEQSGTNTASSATGIDYTGVAKMNIGSLGGRYYLTGAMDELEIYNRVLSAEEIGKKFGDATIPVVTESPELGAIVPSAIVHKWDFAEKHGGMSEEFYSGGPGFNMDVHGIPTQSTCFFGECVSFEQGYLKSDVDLRLTSDFTISAWVKPSINDKGIIISSYLNDGNPSENGFGWSFGRTVDTDKLGFVAYGLDAGDIYQGTVVGHTGFFGANLDKWTHLAVTFGDYASGFSTLTLYVDGVAVDTTSTPMKDIWYQGRDGSEKVNAIRIGALGDAAYGNSEIGEIVIYGGVKSGQEIAELAKLPVGCGNGVWEPDEKEQCDPAPGQLLDGCDTFTCLATSDYQCQNNVCGKVAECGDNIQHFTEECDDGAEVDGDGCSATCTLELSCPVPDTGLGIEVIVDTSGSMRETATNDNWQYDGDAKPDSRIMQASRALSGTNVVPGFIDRILGGEYGSTTLSLSRFDGNYHNYPVESTVEALEAELNELQLRTPSGTSKGTNYIAGLEGGLGSGDVTIFLTDGSPRRCVDCDRASATTTDITYGHSCGSTSFSEDFARCKKFTRDHMNLILQSAKAYKDAGEKLYVIGVDVKADTCTDAFKAEAVGIAVADVGTLTDTQVNALTQCPRVLLAKMAEFGGGSFHDTQSTGDCASNPESVECLYGDLHQAYAEIASTVACFEAVEDPGTIEGTWQFASALGQYTVDQNTKIAISMDGDSWVGTLVGLHPELSDLNLADQVFRNLVYQGEVTQVFAQDTLVEQILNGPLYVGEQLVVGDLESPWWPVDLIISDGQLWSDLGAWDKVANVVLCETSCTEGTCVKEGDALVGICTISSGTEPDADLDGVVDSIDQCNDTPAGQAVESSGAAAGCMLGDVDMSGSIGPADAVMVLQGVVGTITLTEKALAVANVDCSAGVLPGDAVKILQKVVGTIENFNCG